MSVRNCAVEEMYFYFIHYPLVYLVPPPVGTCVEIMKYTQGSKFRTETMVDVVVIIPNQESGVFVEWCVVVYKMVGRRVSPAPVDWEALPVKLLV